MTDIQKIIGMSREEAQKTLQANGLTLRCQNLNGQSLIGTCDYRTDRVNVAIRENKITKVIGIG